MQVIFRSGAAKRKRGNRRDEYKTVYWNKDTQTTKYRTWLNILDVSTANIVIPPYLPHVCYCIPVFPLVVLLYHIFYSLVLLSCPNVFGTHDEIFFLVLFLLIFCLFYVFCDTQTQSDVVLLWQTAGRSYNSNSVASQTRVSAPSSWGFCRSLIANKSWLNSQRS